MKKKYSRNFPDFISINMKYMYLKIAKSCEIKAIKMSRYKTLYNLRSGIYRKCKCTNVTVNVKFMTIR